MFVELIKDQCTTGKIICAVKLLEYRVCYIAPRGIKFHWAEGDGKCAGKLCIVKSPLSPSCCMFSHRVLYSVRTSLTSEPIHSFTFSMHQWVYLALLKLWYCYTFCNRSDIFVGVNCFREERQVFLYYFLNICVNQQSMWTNRLF